MISSLSRKEEIQKKMVFGLNAWVKLIFSKPEQLDTQMVKEREHKNYFCFLFKKGTKQTKNSN